MQAISLKLERSDHGGVLCRPDERVWSAHNVMMRMVVTTIYMIFITFIACLIPFFGCASIAAIALA